MQMGPRDGLSQCTKLYTGMNDRCGKLAKVISWPSPLPTVKPEGLKT